MCESLPWTVVWQGIGEARAFLVAAATTRGSEDCIVRCMCIYVSPFCTDVPPSFLFLKCSCASFMFIYLFFSPHEAAEYNRQYSKGAEHIRQTTSSILGTAHLTQILLYECKPIK